VYLLLTDRERCNVVDVGLLIARTLYRLYPKQFPPEKMAHLLLHPTTLDAIRAGKSLKEIRALWQPELDGFFKRRANFLIYK
jgi:uncharacterized protein YbbC (DUF1343 family)